MDIPEEYVNFVTALKEDKKLQKWFRSLETMPDNLRISTVGQMVIQMEKDNADDKLIRIIGSLSDSNIYFAISKCL